MSPSPVTLPSAISSPTRVFYSPFPPPNQQQQQHEKKTSHIIKQKHFIRPYEISTSLAKSYDIYSKQTLSPPMRVSSLANSQENLHDSSDNSISSSSSTNSSISSISSNSSSSKTCYNPDDYYYNKVIEEKKMDDDLYDDDDNDSDIYEPFDDLNYFYFDQSNNKKKDFIKRIPSVPVIYQYRHHQQEQQQKQKHQQSLSFVVTLKPSKSTSAIKTNCSSSSKGQNRLPRWIKHMSQNTSLIDKKRSRGLPSLPASPNHMTFSINSNSNINNNNNNNNNHNNNNHNNIHQIQQLMIISTTTMTLYYGSPLARQYLKSVTKKNQWDDMLKNGFPCPFCSDQEQVDEIRKSINEKRQQFENKNNLHHHHNNKKKKSSCKRCHGQKRLTTLRITLTPQHARANESIIYGNRPPSLPSSSSFSSSISSFTSSSSWPKRGLIDHHNHLNNSSSFPPDSSLHKSSLDVYHSTNKKRQNADSPKLPILVKPSRTRSTPNFKCKKHFTAVK